VDPQCELSEEQPVLGRYAPVYSGSRPSSNGGKSGRRRRVEGPISVRHLLSIASLDSASALLYCDCYRSQTTLNPSFTRRC
jgi:hypothetical protein